MIKHNLGDHCSLLHRGVTEGAVIVMPFFLGAIDDEENAGEADEADARSADSGPRKRFPCLARQRCRGATTIYGAMQPLVVQLGRSMSTEGRINRCARDLYPGSGRTDA